MSRIEEAARTALAQHRADGLLRGLRWIDGAQDAWVSLDGRRVLLLCSNNYLGLANHPALREAAAEAALRYGVGAGASRLISGSMRIHEQLEESLAAFEHVEAALVFPTGYHANIGAITALVGRDDAVFSDALNHASLIDGCRLSGARVEVYPHCDVEALDASLKRVPARRKLVVTDTVFSMDGDVAPLRDICEVASHHGAFVMVDEAHATGVMGPTGAGAVEGMGLQGRVDVQMVTLGKALGAAGAATCGSRALMDLFVNRARSFIYTTALAPPLVAAAKAALEVVRREPERRRTLAAHSCYLRQELQRIGYSVPDGVTPIIPVHVGDSGAAVRLSELLLERGVFVQAIRPPTVPQGTARLRVTVMATHTVEDLNHAIAAFRGVRGL